MKTANDAAKAAQMSTAYQVLVNEIKSTSKLFRNWRKRKVACDVEARSRALITLHRKLSASFEELKKHLNENLGYILNGDKQRDYCRWLDETVAKVMVASGENRAKSVGGNLTAIDASCRINDKAQRLALALVTMRTIRAMGFDECNPREVNALTRGLLKDLAMVFQPKRPGLAGYIGETIDHVEAYQKYLTDILLYGKDDPNVEITFQPLAA